MSTLTKHMIKVACALMTRSPVLRWKHVLAQIDAEGGLTEAERSEAETVGKKKVAKQAIRIAKAPTDAPLLVWVDGSIPAKGGARIPRATADIPAYNWLIEQTNKTIADFTRYRDGLIAERDALIAAREQEVQAS